MKTDERAARHPSLCSEPRDPHDSQNAQVIRPLVLEVCRVAHRALWPINKKRGRCTRGTKKAAKHFSPSSIKDSRERTRSAVVPRLFRCLAVRAPGTARVSPVSLPGGASLFDRQSARGQGNPLGADFMVRGSFAHTIVVCL